MVKGQHSLLKKYHGAVYGQGFGMQGNSYAIPTKDSNLKTLPLTKIREYVNLFIQDAKKHHDKVFQLTPIGCGLAGYAFQDIAPMFADAPPNVILPKEFIDANAYDSLSF